MLHYNAAMFKMIAAASLLLAAFSAAGQTSGSQSQGLPTDPRAIFKAAAPLYDFNDPALKPWHMKAHYQLYDALGKPGETGTFEYWWASPKVHRRTWTRPSASRSEWSTADGKHFYQASGEALHYFERDPISRILWPLPAPAVLDSPQMVLQSKMAKAGGIQFHCVMLVPEKAAAQEGSSTVLGSFPAYCFDPKAPVLRFSYSERIFTTVYSRIEQMQERNLPMEVRVMAEDRTVFSVTVDSVTSFDPANAALKPPVDATEIPTPNVSLSSGVAEGALIKKVPPEYPPIAVIEKLQGTVLIHARIGTDGKIYDPEVVISPGSVLTKAALDAVTQWQYRPYLLHGPLVEVSANIHVIFVTPR